MTVIRDLDRHKKEIDQLHSGILKHLKKEFYGELIEELRKSVEGGLPKVLNAPQKKSRHLLRALHSGQVTFHRGAFYGRFSSRISRELKAMGAKWHKKEKAWVILKAEVPKEVRAQIDTSEGTLRKKVETIKKKIATISPAAVAAKFDGSKILDRTIFQANESIKEKIKGVTVAPQLTKEARKQLTTEYNKNIQKDIKEWTQKEIKALREEVRAQIDTSEGTLRKKVETIKKKIATISPAAVAAKFDGSKILDRTIFEANESIKEKIKGVTVAPQLTKEARKQLTTEYNKNIQKDIKEWTQKEIKALREEVEAFVFKGGRAEDLKDIIRKSYGESESRSKFIAAQETRLMTAKFRESRYRSAGSEGYYWRTVKGSPGHPVRPTHEVLNGKFFKWTDPPVTSNDGRRNHPGEDYNCRCYPDVVI